MRRKLMLGLITTFTTLCYPFLIYFALDHVEPRLLALVLAALWCLRWLQVRSGFGAPGMLTLLFPLGAIFLALIAVGNREDWLLAYPILVSALFLTLFGHSLYQPPSMVERLARLREPDLSPAGVAYTRKVTQIWCGFFVFNGLISAVTVWYGDRLLWSLYNGFLAYVLMGTLMACEWLLRDRLRSRF